MIIIKREEVDFSPGSSCGHPEIIAQEEQI
jgi:hypothetical protein